MQRKHSIAIVIILTAAVAGLLWFFAFQQPLPSIETALQRGAGSVSPEEIRGGTVEKADERGKEIYRNAPYGFSFTYPAGYTVGSFVEGNSGDVILVQNPVGRESFQIYVAPFDESGTITLERIHRDVPDLAISDSQRVVIGSGKIEALIFIGESEGFGRSREVWFVHGGHLYQITTYADLDAFIGPIMESWRFEIES